MNNLAKTQKHLINNVFLILNFVYLVKMFEKSYGTPYDFLRITKILKNHMVPSMIFLISPKYLKNHMVAPMTVFKKKSNPWFLSFFSLKKKINACFWSFFGNTKQIMS